MMRVAVIGSTGQLGSDLVQVFQSEGYEIFALTHADVECTDLEVVRAVVTAVRPDIVVNCAAFVRVDECQDQPLKALQVNALGALYVARVCAELEALCVYVSTDYVFDGEKGDAYTEADSPCPINVYGTSKLAGEHLVQQACRRWLIVRVASLFGQAGARGKGGNFIETLLARVRSGEPIRVVKDIRMSPTYTHDAARALERLLRQGTTGLFHLTNAGACTWYEFARKTLELAGFGDLPEPIAAQDYPARARRPRDSSLRSTRLDGLVQACLRPWDEALESYLVAKGWSS
ncbi:MAG: dTDP-4-dehydrorhamnose reductase [Dehalococcoidia bacterium]